MRRRIGFPFRSSWYSHFRESEQSAAADAALATCAHGACGCDGYSAAAGSRAGQTALLSIAAGEGTTMLVSFRLLPYFPFRLTWDARITKFAWNESFCDEQVRGPFATWLHCHTVAKEMRDGKEGTTVFDAVTYSLPGGVMGDALSAVVVRNEVRKLFRHRQLRLREVLPVVARQAGLS